MEIEQIDNYIKEKYLRTDENDMRGTNSVAVNKFINMIHKHLQSDNQNIRAIGENIDKLATLAPNFILFEEQNKSANFMKIFNAMVLGNEAGDLVTDHEFGHAVYKIMCNEELDKNDFEGVVDRAKANILSKENKEDFKKYIVYLTDRNNKNRTEAEKGPLSDILSSIFRCEQLSLKHQDGTISGPHIFPSYHSHTYYADENGKMKADVIFDEDFANFYALSVNNCTRELNVLKRFLGDEWFQSMQNTLERAGRTVQDQTIQQDSPTITEKISDQLLGVSLSELPERLPEIEREKEESDKELE